MIITASIVTYNHHLLEFEPVLRSLFASPVDVIYVIDHSDSMLELKAELQEFARRVLKGEPGLRQKEEGGFKVIYLPHENHGYGAGHNVGIREAMKLGSRYHLVVNPDVWFGPEVMPKLVKYMEDNPDVGQMMPKVLFPNGQIQRLAKMLPTPADLVGRLCLPHFFIKRRNTLFELQQSGFTKILNVPYLSGCFMFFRVSALEDVGLFDEQFFMYAEDVDMTRRVHQKYKTLYYPCATIYHTFTRGSRKTLRLFRIHVMNMIMYFNKWGWFKDEERDRVNEDVRRQIGGQV